MPGEMVITISGTRSACRPLAALLVGSSRLLTAPGLQNWHPDEEAGIWGSAFSTTAGDADPEDRLCFALKLAFYLDPLSKDTGCLSVVPGI